MQTEEDNFLNDIRLPVAALRRGLFVARLDRPWRDSPFLFLGFVVNAEKELQQIRELCEWIEVTPERSDPAAWKQVPKEAQSPAGRPPTGDPMAMSRPRTVPGSKPPSVPDNVARLEAERLAAAGRGVPPAASASGPLSGSMPARSQGPMPASNLVRWWATRPAMMMARQP